MTTSAEQYQREELILTPDKVRERKLDRDDISIVFRALTMILRHFAKKYGFSIQGYEPEG